MRSVKTRTTTRLERKKSKRVNRTGCTPAATHHRVPPSLDEVEDASVTGEA